MNKETNAWKLLEEKAASRLSGGFADRVLRASKDPSPAVWQLLQERGASQLHPGFAERVLRAVRSEMPSFFGQVTISAVTAAACLFGVIYLHERSIRIEDERNLADWQQLMTDSSTLAGFDQ